MIASSTSVALNGSPFRPIKANGGDGDFGGFFSSGGGASGGAIRVIAPTITGSGLLEANEGGSPSGGNGAKGRIRLEAFNFAYTGFTQPVASTGLPQPIFPGTGQPTLTIASVGGLPAPTAPVGSVLGAPDILLPVTTTNPVGVALTASNIPLGTVIQVTASPQSGAKTTATSTGLVGTLASSTAMANLTISLTQINVLTATATFPLVASAGDGPLFAEGEEITHVRVAAVFGGGTQVTYLTRSGREIVLR